MTKTNEKGLRQNDSSPASRSGQRNPSSIRCLFLCLILLLAGCSMGEPVDTAASETPPALQTLTGTLIDATTNVLALETDDGTVYRFARQDDITVAPDAGMEIGCIVRISYYGALTKTDGLQDAEVIRISIASPETVSTPEASFTASLVSEPAPSQTAPEGTQSTAAAASSHAERAQQILSEMSLEEKVGQIFIVRCPQEKAAEQVKNYHLGGYILFAEDFAHKDQETVAAATAEYQAASRIPLLIGVDEEGGTVNRISRYQAFRSTPFASPQELYREGGWKRIESDAAEKASLLRSLGINLNLAPVCDISTNPNDYIYKRTFGKDAAQTAEYVSIVVSAMKQNGMGCVLKHFPGYGGNVDTHTGLSHDNRSIETFRSNDFLPFQSGMEAGAGAVLVSHNIVSCMDESSPASLSPEVHRLLREELHFDGVIMTDDLYMDAIQDFTGKREAAVRAVQAGNDLLCCTDFEIQIPAVLDAVKRGDIAPELLDRAVQRVLIWKMQLGILS